MIDFLILNNSVEYYERSGFKRIEAPWTVTKAVSAITKLIEKIDWEITGKNKVLVASGEQGFLYLSLKGFLPPGKYMTITPCFREEVFDITHTKYFMKNELIDTENVTKKNLIEIVNISHQFMKSYIPDCYIIETKEGFDINYNDIELGSYGIRTCPYLKWIYATGVAEPRFSNTIKMIKDGLS
jgi:hypothetical protein